MQHMTLGHRRRLSGRPSGEPGRRPRAGCVWTRSTVPHHADRSAAAVGDAAGRHDPSDLTVVMEPTRNAWVPLAAWFRRRGARVVLVPPEQSADLRDYYTKHIKSDRLDSRMLARLPLLHPDGLHPETGLGPGDPLRRATKLHASLVKRRTTVPGPSRCLLEMLGPGWHAALRRRPGQQHTAAVPRRRLRRPAHAATARPGPADPVPVPALPRRLGRTRTPNGCSPSPAETVDAVGRRRLDYGDLADDIAVEARLALQLTAEIHELDAAHQRAARRTSTRPGS